MCGRVVRTSPRGVIAAEFGVTSFAEVDLAPRYNIAPSQALETIIDNHGERRLGPMRWGFTADSRAESRLAPINARAETVATSPMFRDAFRRRRCLVVADGFYEWKKDGKRKVPYFIHLRSEKPFAFAGIWTFDHAADGRRLPTCAILTCAPNDLLAAIHNRMPVIVAPGARDRWLESNAGVAELRDLLVPLPSEQMEAYEVSTLVSSPSNDSPECLARVAT